MCSTFPRYCALRSCSLSSHPLHIYTQATSLNTSNLTILCTFPPFHSASRNSRPPKLFTQFLSFFIMTVMLLRCQRRSTLKKRDAKRDAKLPLRAVARLKAAKLKIQKPKASQKLNEKLSFLRDWTPEVLKQEISNKLKEQESVKNKFPQESCEVSTESVRLLSLSIASMHDTTGIPANKS